MPTHYPQTDSSGLRRSKKCSENIWTSPWNSSRSSTTEHKSSWCPKWRAFRSLTTESLKQTFSVSSILALSLSESTLYIVYINVCCLGGHCPISSPLLVQQTITPSEVQQSAMDMRLDGSICISLKMKSIPTALARCATFAKIPVHWVVNNMVLYISYYSYLKYVVWIHIKK